MSMNMNNYSSGGGADLGQAAPGAHLAALIGIVDLGIQNGGTWKGTPKPPCQQLILIFELLDDQVTIEGVVKNRIFSTKVWAKRGEKAKLYKIYSTLDPANVHGGDLAGLVGSYCNLSLKAEAGERENLGKTFIKFDSLMAPLQGQQFPPTMNEYILFNTEDLATAPTEYAKLHGWMREAVKASLSYEGSQLSQIIAQVEAQEAAVPQPQGQPGPQPQAGAGQILASHVPTAQTQAPAQVVPQTGLPGAPVNVPAQVPVQTTAPSQAPTPTPNLPQAGMPPFPGGAVNPTSQVPAQGPAAGIQQAGATPATQQQTVSPGAPTNIPQAPPGFVYDPATGGFLPIQGGA